MGILRTALRISRGGEGKKASGKLENPEKLEGERREKQMPRPIIQR